MAQIQSQPLTLPWSPASSCLLSLDIAFPTPCPLLPTCPMTIISSGLKTDTQVGEQWIQWLKCLMQTGLKIVWKEQNQCREGFLEEVTLSPEIHSWP